MRAMTADSSSTPPTASPTGEINNNKKRPLEDPESPPAKRKCIRRQLFPLTDDNGEEESQGAVDSGDLSTYSDECGHDASPPCSPSYPPESPSFEPQSSEYEEDSSASADDRESQEGHRRNRELQALIDSVDDGLKPYQLHQLSACKDLFSAGAEGEALIRPHNIEEIDWQIGLIVARIRSMVISMTTLSAMLACLAMDLYSTHGRLITNGSVQPFGNKPALILTPAEVQSLIETRDSKVRGLDWLLADLADDLYSNWQVVFGEISAWLIKERIPKACRKSMDFVQDLTIELGHCRAAIEALHDDHIDRLRASVSKCQAAKLLKTTEMFVLTEDCDVQAIRKFQSVLRIFLADVRFVRASAEDNLGPLSSESMNALTLDLDDFGVHWDATVSHLEKIIHRHTYVKRSTIYVGPPISD